MKFIIPAITATFITSLLAQSDSLSEAARLSGEGHHADSTKVLEEAMEIDPGNEILNYRLAGELVFDRKFAEARTRYQQLVKSQNPDIASMATNNLAALDRIEAEERKAAEPAAPDPEYLKKQAEYKVQVQKLESRQKAYDLLAAECDGEAVKHIESLESRGDADTQLLLEKAFALGRLRQYNKAVETLEKIPPQVDTDGNIKLALADYLSKAGRTKESYQILRGLCKADGDSAVGRTAASQIQVLPPAYDLDRWAWGELDLYGIYLSRYNIGIADGRLREGTFVPGARWLEPFVQGDFSLDSSSGSTTGGGIPTIYNENLAGFHAGLQARPFANQTFVFYVLGGVQKDLRGTAQHHGHWFGELIAGLNGFWAWGPGKEWASVDLETLSPGGMRPLASRSKLALNSWMPARPRLDWFVEAGGDAAYYTRLPDGIAYLQSRQGFRILQLGKAGAVDAYALENLTMDTKGNYYDNYFEAGPGARFVTVPVGSAVFTTSVDYVLGSYLGRNANNTRGDTSANYADFRVTMSLSMRW